MCRVVWAGWLVSGGEGWGSGGRERGFANVYKSLSLPPVPVRAFCPVVNVSTGSFKGKPPEGRQSPSGGEWACIYVELISNMLVPQCFSLRVLFVVLSCFRGCGCLWVVVVACGWAVVVKCGYGW
jgi:hypothetical protein